ncbi:MAG TPA: MFS transporter [Candidatus Binatia bacterium]
MEQVNAQTVTLQAISWNRLATTAVAHMTEHLYIGITTVVLPVIAATMGLSMAQAGSLVSARYLVAGLANIPSGVLADTLKRRHVLLGVCLVCLGLGSLLMSFATSFWLLLFFMAIGGLGSGSFHPQSIAILSSAYRDRRALALGVHDSAANWCSRRPWQSFYQKARRCIRFEPHRQHRQGLVPTRVHPGGSSYWYQCPRQCE